MKYSEIKNSGIKIPSIIFGTSALGNLYKSLDKKTKLDIVRECLKSVDGPVVFDTAGKYGAGLALEELGRVLYELEVKPEKVVISISSKESFIHGQQYHLFPDMNFPGSLQQQVAGLRNSVLAIMLPLIL